MNLSVIYYTVFGRIKLSPVKIFRLTTVTYGTKSAPYLATRSLKQLAIDDGDKYPLAAEVIMSDVYMDDLTGADDLEPGRKLQVQLISMLKGAGIELHKWSANNPLLLPDSMCQIKDLSYSSTETKTLGPQCTWYLRRKIKLCLIFNDSFYFLTFIHSCDHSRQGKLIF
ncbi:integrase catalytic domain-containing protein [Trichonephila clavipes]|nr:integrase catalytic domain-containing protein [Trichonephila clavipes]